MTTKESNKANKKKSKEYKVGDKIYIPTSLYLSHGIDDFEGGLCKILEMGEDKGWKWIRVHERPEYKYGYSELVNKQEKLKEEYGTRRGRKDPDYSFESNCWASPGDIVNGKAIDYYIF